MRADRAHQAGRRAAAPWRVAFVVYAAALFTSTHWPEMSLGGGESPWPDKLIHMAAFGGLALLLVMTGWVRAWIALCMVAVWTVADELSQSVPLLGRTLSPQDVVAGLLGVIVAAAWTWALRPVGGAPSRMRRAHLAFLLERSWSRPTTWLLVAIVGAAAAAASGAAARLLLRGALGLDAAEANRWAFVAACLGGLAWLHLVLAVSARGAARRAQESLPCFRCRSSCLGADFDEFGCARCPGCGGAIHRGQWSEPMELPASVVMRDALGAIVAAAALLLGLASLYGAIVAVSARITAAKGLLMTWERMTPDLQLGFDMAALAVIAAVAASTYRQRDARRFDLQHRRCRCCGHDLSATPLDRGQGRCGECGLTFVRLAEQPEAITEARRDGADGTE